METSDFLEFLREYGVIALALAVVIGAAVTDLVNSVVEDIIMPIVGVFLPGDGWRTATYTIYHVEFGIGHLIGELLDFMIIAFLVYLFIRHVLRQETADKV